MSTPIFNQSNTHECLNFPQTLQYLRQCNALANPDLSLRECHIKSISRIKQRGTTQNTESSHSIPPITLHQYLRLHHITMQHAYFSLHSLHKTHLLILAASVPVCATRRHRLRAYARDPRRHTGECFPALCPCE